MALQECTLTTTLPARAATSTTVNVTVQNTGNSSNSFSGIKVTNVEVAPVVQSIIDNNASFTVYPNPTSSSWTIEGGQGNLLEVYNYQGTKVYTQLIVDESTNIITQ